MLAMLLMLKLCRKHKLDCHFENCTDCPGYVYNFNTQSLLTFQEIDILNISLVAYINFETAVLTNECLDPKNRKMFAASYVMTFCISSQLGMCD